MTPGATIRVGVVGHGHFGAYHAKQYAAHPGANLVGIADPAAGAADAIKSAYGEIHVSDYRDLIGQVDAVSVAVPTGLHEAVAIEFIDAGVHLLIEKPLCGTADAARRLSERAAKAGVVLHVGHIERFSSVFGRLKAELLEPPLLIEADRHAPWLGRILDVDVVLDMMIHDIDLVFELIGSRAVGVEASGVEMMGHGLDAVLARIDFENGAVAQIAASRVAPSVSRVMRVVEAARTLTVDFGAGSLGIFDAAGKSASEQMVPPRDALRAEIQAFLDAVAGVEDLGVGGAAATRALELADLIRSGAMATGRNPPPSR
ncbi:MAG: Gfo/Idh/MocA family oxidoreductase [Alphaproteobacteria bacterium]